MNVGVEPKATSTSLVRKRTFEPRTVDDVVIILARLQNENHSGPITIEMSQGGIRGMSAEDRARLPT